MVEKVEMETLLSSFFFKQGHKIMREYLIVPTSIPSKVGMLKPWIFVSTEIFTFIILTFKSIYYAQLKHLAKGLRLNIPKMLKPTTKRYCNHFLSFVFAINFGELMKSLAPMNKCLL